MYISKCHAFMKSIILIYLILYRNSYWNFVLEWHLNLRFTRDLSSARHQESKPGNNYPAHRKLTMKCNLISGFELFNFNCILFNQNTFETNSNIMKNAFVWWKSFPFFVEICFRDIISLIFFLIFFRSTRIRENIFGGH